MKLDTACPPQWWRLGLTHLRPHPALPPVLFALSQALCFVLPKKELAHLSREVLARTHTHTLTHTAHWQMGKQPYLAPSSSEPLKRELLFYLYLCTLTGRNPSSSMTLILTPSLCNFCLQHVFLIFSIFTTCAVPPLCLMGALPIRRNSVSNLTQSQAGSTQLDVKVSLLHANSSSALFTSGINILRQKIRRMVVCLSSPSHIRLINSIM